MLVADCLSFKSMAWFLTTVLRYYYFTSRDMELILHYPEYSGREAGKHSIA